MTLTGIVRGTMIELTSGGPLPDGAVVTLEASVEPIQVWNLLTALRQLRNPNLPMATN